MSTITVDLPEKIAQRFRNKVKIWYNKLIEDYENYGWTDYDVDLDIKEFIMTIEKIL
jgi:hypothetical protein